MKKVTGLIGMATLALMLSACSGDDDNAQKNSGSIDDGEQTNENGSIDHGVKEKGELDGEDGGYSINGVAIEEAVNVPSEAKEAILETFERYIDTLNAGEVDAYLETLSADGYDIDEEREATESMLATTELTRTPDDITIVKYTENEAQVFATMKIEVKDKDSEEAEITSGRQVTVLTQKDGNWKVNSINAIADPVPSE